MNQRKLALLLSMVVFGVGIFASSVFAGPKYQTVSGLECVYVDTEPSEFTTYGNLLHISGQVNRNVFTSDNPEVLSDGVHLFAIDIWVNLDNGMAYWKGKGNFQSEGMGDWQTVGYGQVDPALGGTGKGVMRGAGDYQGYTVWQDLSQGDLGQCEEGAFDATIINAVVVPPKD
jgi:hypothetical protein